MFGTMFLIGAAAAAFAQNADITGPAPGKAMESFDLGKARAADASPAKGQAALDNCDSRRFESSAAAPIAGKTRRSTIRMCAAPTDSNADWIAKLEKAAVAVEAQGQLPAAVKLKLLGDLRAEIARLKSGGEQAAVAAPAIIAPRPLPKAAPAQADYAQLPPLPPPVPRAAAVARGPLVTIRCIMPWSPDNPVECDSMEQETVIAVRAEEEIESPVRLRFSGLNSSREAEVALSSRGMRRGEMLRIRVPKEMCKRVYRTEFNIEVLADGRADAKIPLGPFHIRC